LDFFYFVLFAKSPGMTFMCNLSVILEIVIFFFSQLQGNRN